jgi:hypothetical protein
MISVVGKVVDWQKEGVVLAMTEMEMVMVAALKVDQELELKE